MNGHRKSWLVPLVVMMATILLILFSPTRKADALEPSLPALPYVIEVQASAYGPCCYEGAPGAGYISYHGEYQKLLPWKSSVASPYLRRGTGICVAVPAQSDAAGSALQTLGALKCDRPLVPAASGQPLHEWRGRLTISDHIPTRHNRHDLSRGFLDDIGFCHVDEGEYACLYRWGVRTVRIHVFG